MTDWAAVLSGMVLFVLLQPGLLCSFAGHSKQPEFTGMKTNGKAIFIDTVLFFALYDILLLALHTHTYIG